MLFGTYMPKLSPNLFNVSIIFVVTLLSTASLYFVKIIVLQLEPTFESTLDFRPLSLSFNFKLIVRLTLFIGLPIFGNRPGLYKNSSYSNFCRVQVIRHTIDCSVAILEATK